MYDAVIIGGGAAGLAAAIRAHGRGKKILVAEAAPRVGKKLLLAGGGKCNISNECVLPRHYNGEFAARFLEDSRMVGEFFKEIGLKTRTVDGRIYPYSESGNTVVNVLRAALPSDLVRTDFAVEKIVRGERKYIINGIETAKAVLAAGSAAATGRASYRLAEDLGHTVTPLRPALVPLKSDTAFIKGLAGVRVKARLTLSADGKTRFSEEGEILFKSDGVSGILSMDASRFADNRAVNTLSVDFAPDMTDEEVEAFISAHGSEGIVQRTLAQAIRAQSAARKREEWAVLKDFRIDDARPAHFKQAQVVRGGLETGEFGRTLESRLSSGFYACGEVLDVDGACGGYNLHWAFLSGLTVGNAI